MEAIGISDDWGDWQRDCASELAMPHENDVFLKFVLLASILGFDKVSFGLEIPTSVAAPAFVFFANYAPDWHYKFVERHPKYHGARVAYGKRTAPALEAESAYWCPDDFYREAAANNIAEQDIMRFAVPFGCVSYFALEPKNSNDAMVERTNSLIRLTNTSMTRILFPKHLPQSGLSLTPTEVSIMRWVLDGKTAGEISDIMSIGKSAIENHQRKLQERFETKGIFATAFLAYRMGMLTLVPGSPIASELHGMRQLAPGQQASFAR